MSDSVSSTSMRMAAIRLKSANKHIFRALLSLASATLLTRMMGMVNQVIVSSRFGAGATMDAYFVATTSPTILAYLIIGAIETAVIPVYARVRSQGGKERSFVLFSTLLNLLFVCAILITLVMFVLRQQVILFSAPALDSVRLGLAINLTPFIYPVIVPMVIIGFLECILNTEGQFGLPAYAGLLVPLTTGVLVLVMGKSEGVVMLCVGTLVGLSLQFCSFIFRIRKAKIVYRPIIDLRMPEIGAIVKAIWPVLLGSLIGQASPLIDQIFASFLSTGSISSLSYALKIVSVCSSVIFASVGRAALPYLSRQIANKDMKSFKGTLRLYLWTVGIVTTVLSILVILLAHPIVQVLFQRGAFSAEDTDRTAVVLVGFIFGLAPMALGTITSRAFSALGKNHVLMGVSIFSIIADVIFDAICGHFWQAEGIAIATSIYYSGTMLIMFVVLSRMIGSLNLFTVPPEIVDGIKKISKNKRYVLWKTLLQEYLFPFSISDSSRQLVVRLCFVITIFLVGAYGVLQNSLYTLRVAIGSIFVLALLRYQYALLIVWVLISAVLSPNIPFLTNNNFLSGLTVPTILLLTSVPVKPIFQGVPPLRILLLFLLWVLAGIGISPISIGGFLIVWLTYLDYFAIAILTIHLVTTRQRLLGLIDAIMLGTTFVSLFGIYGYVTKQDGVLDPTTSLFRIYSIFTAAPTLALFLSVVIPVAVFRAFTLQGLKRLGASILVLIFLLALGLTFTRGAFISIPVSVLVMILFLPSSKAKSVLLSGIGALVVVAILLSTIGNVPIFNRFLNQDVGSLNGRTYLWQAILDHFDPTHLLGYGLKSSDALLANLQVGFGGGVIATSASNLYLQTLYDHGIIGLALLSLIFIVILASLIKGIRRTKGDQRNLFVVGLAVLINMLIECVEVNDLWTQAIGLYFWVIIALPFVRYWTEGEQRGEERRQVLDQVVVPQMRMAQPEVREPVSLSPKL